MKKLVIGAARQAVRSWGFGAWFGTDAGCATSAAARLSAVATRMRRRRPALDDGPRPGLGWSQSSATVRRRVAGGAAVSHEAKGVENGIDTAHR